MGEILTLGQQQALADGRWHHLLDRIGLLEERVARAEQKSADDEDYTDRIAVRVATLDDEYHGRGKCRFCVERDAIVRGAMRTGATARLVAAAGQPGPQPAEKAEATPALTR
jgi:hypothetical protein